ncbi:aspartic proteinase [Sclerotinia borealis F-4128]|uniref:Aspartic proteinase n=1 Tax=Sclerotinia borealis (strain F-4128) TaxID=1432307 RepID=W9CJW1_SCLBF|nr:aspartic proteinase [Sclerotinia borealis F-4128]
MWSFKISLFTLFALLQYSSAFYIYFPEYRCELYKDCPETSKREIESRESNTVLKLVQKLPSADIPRDVQIRDLADRLIRKYNPEMGIEATRVKERGSTLVKNDDASLSIESAAIPTQTNSAGIMQTGTDFSYFAQVELGSENDPLLMLLDTGAGTSWIMGPDCTSTACKTRASFGAADSSTYKAVDMDLDIAYGSGHVTGTYATDTINFADLSFPFTLGIANSTSDQFNSFPFSGILGLSQQTGPVPNFLQTVISSKSLKANVFGMDLNRASDGINTGEINFGAPDTSRYSGSLSYTGVAKNGPNHWAIPLGNVGYGDTQVGITGRLGYLDSGTSYVFGQPTDVIAFHALVPDAITTDNNTWTVPCSTTTPISFTFSGVTYNVSSKDWVGPSVNGVCTSNVYGVAVVDKNSWLIGDTFFKNIYAVFDVDQNRVGLAQKNDVISSTTSTSSSGRLTSTITPPTLTTQTSIESTRTSIVAPTITLSPGSGTGLTITTSEPISNTNFPVSTGQTGITLSPLLPEASTTASAQSSEGTVVSDSPSTSATSTHSSSGNRMRSYISPITLSRQKDGDYLLGTLILHSSKEELGRCGMAWHSSESTGNTGYKGS